MRINTEQLYDDYLKTYISACNCFINLINKANVNTTFDKEVLKSFINLEDAIFNEDKQ